MEKTKGPQDLTADVAATELKKIPGYCEESCTGPSGSVKTNFNILDEDVGLVKKLAKRLQI